MWLLLALACARDPVGDLARASLGADATSPFSVWLLRGGPGGYRRDEAAFAHAFSSLHAIEWDGDLVLVGLPSARPPTWMEERFPKLGVGALATRDGRTWTARSYAVDAPGVSVIDPAIVRGPDGVELWFAQVDGPGDPGQAGRDVRIVRTKWDGARFSGAEVWLSGKGLVDPSPVWFQGAWRLFATKDHADVVVVDAPEAAPRVVMPGCSVPFARATEAGVRVLAQRPQRGRMVAVEAESADLRSWSAPRVVVDDPGLSTCASPVAETVGGQDVVVCVEERRGAVP